MESTHGELRARLANGLRGNDADRFALIDEMTATEVAPIAHGADPVAGVAGHRRTRQHLIDIIFFEHRDQAFVQQGAAWHQYLIGCRIAHVLQHHTAENTITQRHHDLAAFHQRGLHDALGRAAVHRGDHQILADVHQAARQVTGVRGLEGGVGQAFARAVRGNKVLQHVQAFAEVRRNRRLDDRAVRLGHQAAHAGELADLGGAAARARVGHHEDRVERVLHDLVTLGIRDLFLAKLVHHGLGDLLGGARPDVHHLVVALAVGQQAGGILALDRLHLGLGLGNDAGLLGRRHHVVHADRNTGARRIGEAGIHQLVGENHRGLEADAAVAGIDQLGNRLLLEIAIDELERQALGQDLGQQRPADSRIIQLVGLGVGAIRLELYLADAHLDVRIERYLARLIGAMHFGNIGKRLALALVVDARTGHVIKTQHDVLRRHDDRVTVGRRQHVVRGHHQGAGFQLRFERQRDVHRHLVAVEVGVVRRAHQRMQLDGLAFDQHRLECLDAEAMQGRRAVEHHRMFADHFFQDVPDFRAGLLDHLLGELDGGGQALGFELGENERFEQLERHFLRQAALVQLEGRADHNDRTAGVVDALAEQVLAEAALLALDHVGQRLQLALVGAGDRLAAPAVVEQRVHGFLQHALFITHDDIGRIQVEQTLETVVAVDDAAIKIVQVRGRKAAAIERHQRTQLRRQHRQDFEHHPFRLVAGMQERLNHLEALGKFLDLGFRGSAGQLLAQLGRLFLKVDGLEQVAHCFRAHARVEFIAILFDGVEIGLFAEQRAALKRRHARIDDHVGLEIEHALDVAQCHVENQAHARRQRLEEPDVRHRRGQLDVAHALAAHLGERHFDAALLADHAAVLQALVLAAQALVVLDRPEDLGAEQAIALRLEGTIVDGLRLFDLTKRPGTNLFRRRQTNTDGIEIFALASLLEEVK